MLNTFALYLIIEENGTGKNCLKDVIKYAVSNGVTAVQLREKSASTRDFISLGKKIKDLLQIQKEHIPLIINDRVDIAIAIGADGVHLGQSDMSYSDARKILGKNATIGLTVETMEQAEIASKLDVDYLGLSAVFATPTKPEASPHWTSERIKAVRVLTTKKLVGIGGINQTNAQMVLKAGLDGIALSSYICQSPSLSEVAIRTKKLRAILEEHFG